MNTKEQTVNTRSTDLTDLNLTDDLLHLIIETEEAFADPRTFEPLVLTPEDEAALDWDFLEEMEPAINFLYHLCEHVAELATSREQLIQVWDRVFGPRLAILFGPDAYLPDPVRRLPEAYDAVARVCRAVILEPWGGEIDA